MEKSEKKQPMIRIRGANENNLKSVDLDIPRNQFIVFTGLSGSGKSSLAFDTIYAEGQRRYMESLSSYARQFLGQMEKPDVESIEGLPPAISIDQKSTNRNPRSTVGTVTEIYDYFRLLYARVGTVHCPKCGKVIEKQTVDQMVDQLLALPERTRMQLLAPVVRGKKGEHVKILENVVRQGFVRVRIDGEIYDAAEAPALAKQKKHNIEVVVDRLILREDIRTRLTDSLETALSLSGGVVIADIGPGEREMLFSQNLACPDCGISIEELSPRMFSFNNPYGACPTCTGLGAQLKVDPDLIIPNRKLSILEGAITASGWNNIKGDSISRMYFEALSKKYGFKLTTPVEELPEEVMDVILYGTKGEKLKLTYDRENGKGTLTGNNQTGVSSLDLEVASGTQVSVTAVPADGYTFYKWSDGVTDATRYDVINKDVSVTAMFNDSRVELTLDKGDSTIKKGESISITATVKLGGKDYSNSNVQWSVNDELEQNGGTFTFTGSNAGEYTIKAGIEINGTFSAAQIKVTVQADPTSVTVSGPDTATVGNKVTFTANVQNANGDVQWSCEETSWKATGNQVEFTANEAGTYHIHAVNNGADAVFTLHVNAAPTPTPTPTPTPNPDSKPDGQ